MVLEAQTRAEHRHWVNGLTSLCPQALLNGVGMDEFYLPSTAHLLIAQQKRVYHQ